MYNSNHYRYNQLVNFSFVGAGLRGVSNAFTPNTGKAVKAIGLAGTAGAVGAGYLATNSEQNKTKDKFAEIANTTNEAKRQALAQGYRTTNPLTDAARSDVTRGVSGWLGGLGGLAVGVAGVAGYNKLRGRPLMNGLGANVLNTIPRKPNALY